MEENAIVIEMPDGRELELNEAWVIDDERCDSYPEVEIIDCESNHVIGRYRGTLPDLDDEDYDVNELLEEVNNALF